MCVASLSQNLWRCSAPDSLLGALHSFVLRWPSIGGRSAVVMSPIRLSPSGALSVLNGEFVLCAHA